jgi:2-C-methyl-D-erythritol 2,4-cyclodiphosphate synthase
VFKVGFGYDVHKFNLDIKNKDNFIYLCGIKIPHNQSLIAHSDGDVGLHCLVDAILGAACIQDHHDIGQVFPDSDARWKGKSSVYFLQSVKKLIDQNNLFFGNADITIVCQKPKICQYRKLMQEKIADILEVSTTKINVKATTTEGLGFEGRAEGISAYSVVLLHEKQDCK